MEAFEQVAEHSVCVGDGLLDLGAVRPVPVSITVHVWYVCCDELGSWGYCFCAIVFGSGLVEEI